MSTKIEHKNGTLNIGNPNVSIFKILTYIFLFSLTGCNCKGIDQKAKHILADYTLLYTQACDKQTLSTKHVLNLQEKEMESEEERRHQPIGLISTILLFGGIGFYLYLNRKHKEKRWKQERLNPNDPTQTVDQPFEEQPGKGISRIDTVRAFKEESLQKGISSFCDSPWKEKLEEAAKLITSGDYMKAAEQELLYQELGICFEEFITDLTTIYPKMSKDDIYYCILSSLRYRSRTLVYCMRTPAGTLRTHKSRLKKNMAEETFQLIFNK